MSREWCTTAPLGSVYELDSAHLGLQCANREVACGRGRVNSAKVSGDIAAQHGVAAKVVETEVMRKVEYSILRFSTCIVCSRVNLSLWPSTEGSTTGILGNGVVPLVANVEDEAQCVRRRGLPVVSYHTSHLWNIISVPEVIGSLQLPSDQFVDFLNYIVRAEAKTKDYRMSENLRHVSLMPAAAKTVVLQDIFSAIHANHRMLSQICSLTLSGEFNEGASLKDFRNFFQGSKRLELLGLARTKFNRVAEVLLPVMKDTMVRIVDFEGNDLGLSKDDDDTLFHLSEFIRLNKFVVELNLSNNNINGSTAQQLLEALVKSDTRLYPLDVHDGVEGAVVDEDHDVVGLESLSFFAPQEDEEGEEDDVDDDDEVENLLEEEDFGQDDTKGITLLANGVFDEGDEDDDEEAEEDEEAAEIEGENGESAGGDMGEEEGEEDDEEEREEEVKPVSVPQHVLRKFHRLFRHLLKEEREQRRNCAAEYVQGAALLMEEYALIREELAEEKRVEVDTFCRRRSGWSHIQILRLRGNPIGNKGAASVATALRHEMSLEEEEEERIQKDLSNDADRLLNDLVKSYRRTMVEESRQRGRMKSEYLLWLQTLKVGASETSPSAADVFVVAGMDTLDAGGGNAGEDPGQQGNDEERDSIANDEERTIHPGGGDADFRVEVEISSLQDAAGKWSIPVISQKRCVPFLRVLDLGSCQIGSRGLKHIGNVLIENKTLECLLLRRNVFSRRRVAVAVEEDDSDGDQENLPKIADVLRGVTLGCRSLFDALKQNTTLRVLDLAYNDMYPETIRALADGLRTNKTITWLSLEGNRIGFAEPRCGENTESPEEDFLGPPEIPGADQGSPTHSCFYELLSAVSEGPIRALSLGFNDLALCWGDEEVEVLSRLCGQLDVLHLNGNDLGPDHILRWSSAFPEGNFAVRELQLSRNNLSGAKGGGALASLFSRCKGTLNRLYVDQIPLGSPGVAAAFVGLNPSCLKFLSISNSEVAVAASFPTELLASLQEFVVSDNPFTLDELRCLADMLRSYATNLERLSLWSRKVEMESHLSMLRGVLEGVKNLMFADLGVLLRFDGAGDAEDDLGQLEATLTARRVRHSMSAVVVTEG